MAARPSTSDPVAFRSALESLRRAHVRPEVRLAEGPGPTRLAPHAVTLRAEVTVEDREVATGSLVVLFDPLGQEAWQGRFRLVGYASAEVEPELAGDPLLPAVGWTWLTEALDARTTGYRAASGTVTRVASESFGDIASRPPSADVEIRASWTPLDETIGPHLEAWAELLCVVGGLPPAPPGVVSIPTRRRARAR